MAHVYVASRGNVNRSKFLRKVKIVANRYTPFIRKVGPMKVSPLGPPTHPIEYLCQSKLWCPMGVGLGIQVWKSCQHFCEAGMEWTSIEIPTSFSDVGFPAQPPYRLAAAMMRGSESDGWTSVEIGVNNTRMKYVMIMRVIGIAGPEESSLSRVRSEEKMYFL